MGLFRKKDAACAKAQAIDPEYERLLQDSPAAGGVKTARLA